MPDKIIIPQEEVNRLVEIQKRYTQLTKTLGELYYQKRVTELGIELLTAEIENLESDKLTVTEEFEEKYGRGKVNVETSEFIPEN